MYANIINIWTETQTLAAKYESETLLVSRLAACGAF